MGVIQKGKFDKNLNHVEDLHKYSVEALKSVKDV